MGANFRCKSPGVCEEGLLQEGAMWRQFGFRFKTKALGFRRRKNPIQGDIAEACDARVYENTQYVGRAVRNFSLLLLLYCNLSCPAFLVYD